MQDTATSSSASPVLPRVWRGKVLVLVAYVMTVRSSGRTRRVPDAVMLRCEHSDQLRPRFEEHMRERQRTEGFPYILEWEMTGYLPAHREANW